MARRLVVIFFFIAVACCAAGSAHAATQVHEVKAAIEFAKKNGWCEVRGPDKADCQVYRTLCSNGKWSEWVNDSFEFTSRGSVSYKTAGAFSTADYCLLAPVICPTLVISDISEGIANYLKDELDPNVISYLNADHANRSRLPPYVTANCFCACKDGDDLPVCSGKSPGTPYQAGSNVTKEECTTLCGDHQIADKCKESLVASVPSSSSAPTGGTNAAAASVNALCFRPDQCAAQSGDFEAYGACGGGKGRCVAREPEITLNTPIGNVKQIQGLNVYILTAYRWVISIAALAATIAFIYGAFLYLVGSSLNQVGKGKTVMIDAVVGLLLVIGATAILRTLNPDVTRLKPIKVYMVNTVQFILVQYCKDLCKPGAPCNARLAKATDGAATLPYEKVAENQNAFKVTPDQAECGQTYYIEDNPLGDPCEGLACGIAGESCFNCADGKATECQDQASDRRVCAKLKFGGTIDYIDSRRPLRVTLLGFCNYAATVNAEVAETHIEDVDTVFLPSRVGRKAAGVETDDRQVGRAGYQFDFDADDINEIESDDCLPEQEHGGLRGFVIGLNYASAAILQDPDFAILTKQNCNNNQAPFSGYADGDVDDRIQTDNIATLASGLYGVEKPLSEAIACGFANGFLNNAALMWSKEELIAAAEGRNPITCDITMNQNNGIDDPEARMCKKGEIRTVCASGEVCAPDGTICTGSSGTCVCSNGYFDCSGGGADCVDGHDCAVNGFSCKNATQTCTCKDVSIFGFGGEDLQYGDCTSLP